MPLSVLLCRPGGHDLFGGLVARMEGASGDVCHVACLNQDDMTVIEALGAGVHMVPYEGWQQTCGGQAVPLHLSTAQEQGLWRWLRSQVWPPAHYSYGQIAYDAVGLLTHHTARAFPGHGCVCSSLLAMGLAIVGITPFAPTPPQAVDPQQIADWCLSADAKPS